MSGAPADSPCLHPNMNMNVGATGVWPVPRIFTGIKMLVELLLTINSYPCRMVAGVHPDIFQGEEKKKRFEHVKEKLLLTEQDRGRWERNSGQREQAPSD